MHDEKDIRLQLVVDETPETTPLSNIVAQYSVEIDERRQQLNAELLEFETKLHDLEQLDPLDFSGLGKVYRGHAAHLRALIDGIDRGNE
ncbi:MAG: hypothetical protein E2O35_10970 [Proteobacteria bacterium]|nr:MAG: hypothetical protein E2O35_10970 [Pseudomonadota bacterium]